MHDPKTAPYKAKSDKILRTPSLKNANMHKIVEMLTNMMLNITTSFECATLLSESKSLVLLASPSSIKFKSLDGPIGSSGNMYQIPVP